MWDRLRLPLLGILGVVLAGALTVLVFRGRDDGAHRPSLAELAAKNYRTPSPKQSRTLVRYAEKEYRCLVEHGGAVSPPVASSTRISMQAPAQSAHELARLQLACDPEVGPPPQQASLQARPGLVLVYLPKRCLLSPTELPST